MDKCRHGFNAEYCSTCLCAKSSELKTAMEIANTLKPTIGEVLAEKDHQLSNAKDYMVELSKVLNLRSIQLDQANKRIEELEGHLKSTDELYGCKQNTFHTIIGQRDMTIETLLEALEEAANYIEDVSFDHNFNSLGKEDKYRAIAKEVRGE